MKKVVIIGGDHHNTLAVVRAFGKENVEFVLVIHSHVHNIKEINISYSKYVKNINIVAPSEESIIEWLLNNVETEKNVIFPCSDFAAYTIDNNYSKLKNNYIMPGFVDEPGKVVKLMDKYEQKKWADKNNILMAESWKIECVNNKFSIPKNIEFPCIIKPEISAFGNKSDIRIVDDKIKLTECLSEFKEKKYDKLLIQKFLKKKYEVCAFGCIINKNEYYGGIVKKLREYPPLGGGSLTLAQFIDNREINNFINNVIKKLQKDGYNGQYDIELLICDGEIYLNEINFRHSGNGYALIKNGINAPFIWYMNMIDSKFKTNGRLIYENGIFMDEFNELNLLRKKHISFKEFLGDIKKSFSFAVYDGKDIFVGLSILLNKFIKKTKKKEVINNERK